MSLRSRETCYCSNCHEISKFHERFKSHERLSGEVLEGPKAVNTASGRSEFGTMPLSFNPRHGKTRSKNQALRGARLKMAVDDSWYRGENPAIMMYEGAGSFGQETNMVAGPQFGFRAAVHQCLHSMWAQKHLGLFLLFLWILAIMCCLVNSEKLPRHNEALEHGSKWEILVEFFFPTTCTIREDQKIVACNRQPYLSKAECLKSKCCFSSSGTTVTCYAPLRDKPTQMLRAFGFSVISMIILGFLPMYCCFLCRRRKTNRVLKVLKKHKTKLKREHRARKVKDEDRRDKKAQETRAQLLFSSCNIVYWFCIEEAGKSALLPK
ncbi:fragile X mental retardation 1 neighbor protein [Cricetulus griseus]|nr:fragile X mental retardation 1 neighbor protein [Cricetulus griseus]